MLSIRAALAAAVVSFTAALLATAGPEKQCPWGNCVDADVSLHLLQLHANSRRGEAVIDRVMPATNASLFAIEKTVTIKKMYPFYHTSSELQEQAKLLSQGCGGALKMETHSKGGVNIDVLHVRAPKSTPVNKVFILFGEHSRELIGPESALRLLEVICGKVDPGAGVDLASILQENEFQLVINANPASRNRVEDGEYCLRTNPNGVDLNRNWDERWENQEVSGAQTNPGKEPFSEFETQIFKKLVSDFKPTTFLTVHSGTKGMYMPWAYDTEHLATYNAPLMLSLLKELDETHCQCPYGAAGKEVGYPCPGTCLDWVYSKLKTPYVFAFEIFTSTDRDADLMRRWNEIKKDGLNLLQNGAHLGHEHFSDLFSEFSSDFVQRRSRNEAQVSSEDNDCFEMFNPNTEALYNRTVQNWAVAYLEMAAKIAKDLKENPVEK